MQLPMHAEHGKHEQLAGSPRVRVSTGWTTTANNKAVYNVVLRVSDIRDIPGLGRYLQLRRISKKGGLRSDSTQAVVAVPTKGHGPGEPCDRASPT